MNFLKEEKQLLKVIKYTPSILVLCLSFVITFLLLLDKNQTFNKEKKQLEEQYYAQNKLLVKEKVDEIFTNLEHYKEKRDKLFRLSTQQRVNEAYAIAKNLYEKYKHQKTKEEIITLIKESLRNIRFFDGTGYYFLYEPNGKIIMHAFNPELNHKSLWNYKDIQGVYSFRNLSKILEKQNETFFTYYWNNPNKHEKELGFFKLFEPYGFIIGTGNYIDNFENETKKNILKNIQSIRFHQNDGYVFVLNYEGIMLAHQDTTIINTDTSLLSDKNGHAIIKEIIHFAKKNESGFLSYNGVKKPSTQLVSLKTTYVKDFKTWQWVIGSGFYNDSLNLLLESKIKELKSNKIEYIKKIVTFSVILTIILLIISIFISNLIKIKFNLFKRTVERELNKNRQQNIKLEKALDEKKEYENVILHNNLVSITDNKGIIIYSNEAFCEITGYTQNELVGKNHNIMRNHTVPDSFYKNLWQTITNGQTWRGIIPSITKEKKHIYLNTTISPIKDHTSGKIVKFIASRFDITDKINADKELMEKHNILVQQSKMAAMGEMLGAIAHQWRQPLSTISVAATGIKMHKELEILTDDFLIEAMDSINHSVQHLSTTIDDFRNFFIPNKKLNNFYIKDAIEKTLKLISVQFENHNIIIVKNIENFSLYALENELLQVFINLLNNGKDQLLIQNHPKKIILIETKKVNDSFLIEITDSGGGINEKNLDKIFEPYFTTKEDMQGTGIGLYICKNIIEKNMKGTLNAVNKSFEYQDEQYYGASFIIQLPLQDEKKEK
ncbi:MAG: cache domain-containing protein [Candidatus Marinarcus sp.]|uniref:cache domain-containing protein n=1 Tax=Candidatus Marinarcus sp. TaxID=3100987 RepID=UPI003AFF7266